MKRTSLYMRTRRGTGLLEVMIAGTIMLGIMASLMAFTRFSQRSWQNGMAGHTAYNASQLAAWRLASAIRSAMTVDAGSTSTRLVVTHPALASDGSLIVPLQRDVQYTYYVSDASGVEGSSGNILWRKVNGVPDTQWALKGGQGRVVLANTNALSFQYIPNATDPEVVQINLVATNQTGTATRSAQVTENVILRNHKLP
jgi:hypothetical protein